MKKIRKSIGKGVRPDRKMIRKAAVAIHVKGKTNKDAMMEAGWSETTATKSQTALLNSPIYHDEVRKLRASLIEQDKHIYENVAKTMVAGLNANETKFFQYQGTVIDKRNVVSWSERRQYSELIAKVLGAFQPEPEGKGVTLNIEQLAVLITQSREARGLPV